LRQSLPSAQALLREVLESGQRRGFVGPVNLDDAAVHARWFARTVGAPQSFVDLGSGGGLPGLVLACYWSQAQATLVEAQERRAVFLEGAVDRLCLGSRVRVVWMRAEEAGRDETWRGRSDLVVARSFGRPAVTAECGAPFLRVNGRLVVSEPPVVEEERWERTGLALLGLEPMATVHVSDGRQVGSYRVLRQDRLCDRRFPRRVGVPTRRPLF
jgi:16S rRNA (guanine527-N7)-methyltransferase